MVRINISRTNDVGLKVNVMLVQNHHQPSDVRIWSHQYLTVLSDNVFDSHFSVGTHVMSPVTRAGPNLLVVRPPCFFEL